MLKQDLAIIPGTDGYLASSDGRIYRPCKGGWTEMGYSLGSDGYLSVKVRVGGQAFRLRVHRLVLEAFFGPRPEGYVGCHIRDDPWNNGVDNLMWAPHAVNEWHKRVNQDSKRSKHAKNCKLDEYKVVSIIHAIAQGLSKKSLAKRYGVNESVIYKLARGESWKHVMAGDRPRLHEDPTAVSTVPITVEYDPVPNLPCPCSAESNY